MLSMKTRIVRIGRSRHTLGLKNYFYHKHPDKITSPVVLFTHLH